MGISSTTVPRIYPKIGWALFQKPPKRIPLLSETPITYMPPTLLENPPKNKNILPYKGNIEIIVILYSWGGFLSK